MPTPARRSHLPARSRPHPGPAVTVHPLTAERWPDLERLFGPRGALSDCWCMWWRLPAREFTAADPGTRRQSLARRAGQHPAPGLVAYDDTSAPVGWIACAPRAEFGRLERSPLVVRDQPVPPGCWAITCFYIRRDRRGLGVAGILLDAAVAHAAANGARLVEAYPVADGAGRPAADLFPGTLDLFCRAGFVEVGRRRGRPTVRREITS